AGHARRGRARGREPADHRASRAARRAGAALLGTLVREARAFSPRAAREALLPRARVDGRAKADRRAVRSGGALTVRRDGFPPSGRRAIRHAAAAETAVSAGILREILLVIILGVVERLRSADLRRDLSEAARRQCPLIAVAALHGLRAPRVVADVDR